MFWLGVGTITTRFGLGKEPGLGSSQGFLNMRGPSLSCYNNKHAVKVVEQSWIKETILGIGFTWETDSGLLCKIPMFCQHVNSPKPSTHVDFVTLCTTSPCFLLCSRHNYFAAGGRLTIKSLGHNNLNA